MDLNKLLPVFVKSLFWTFFFTCTFCLNAESPLPNFYDDEPHDILAEKIINAMTDEELLAQTFMLGWEGLEPEPLILKWVSLRGLGSIKIFGRNTADSFKLASSILVLQKKAAEGRFSIPLFTATDQEGGMVRHVKGLTTDTPGNLAIGASALPHDAYLAGYYIAKELSVLGINFNFAPTVDLYTNYKSTVIGTRSFGENPSAAGKLGAAFMKGCMDAGVLATAKHFPGHGDTEVDSHGRLPKISISKQKIYSRELVPFAFLVKNRVPAVMSAHVNFPSLSTDGEPATFSKYILNGILRGEMGFDGVIITDDIMMYAATNYAGSVHKAVRLALEAGNDIVESSKTPRLNDFFWTKNISFMKKNLEFKARVKNAAYRIILLKLKYFKSKNHVPLFPDPSAVYTAIPDKKALSFFTGMAARSTVLVRAKEIPFTPSEKEKILIVSVYEDFFKAGKKRFSRASVSKLDTAVGKAFSADTIIFCLSDGASLYVLKKLMKKYPLKKYMIISCLSPVYINGVPEAENVIAVHSVSRFSFAAGFAALLGDFTPFGKMPLASIK